MTDAEFHAAADATLLAIENTIEAAQDEEDIDFESQGGILTLTCANGSKVIINRQTATQEIWVAARSGGFHCGHDGHEWRCNTTQETLSALLQRVLKEQTGSTLHFNLYAL